jgi:hypothetical protein
MKTPHSTFYRYAAETVAHANRLKVGTVSEQAHKQGMTEGEPLIIAMDALLKYAEAYQIRFERPLFEDNVLSDPWLEAAKGIRALLNGDGAIALKRGITTDSKDNGCIESLFWDALRMAGYTEETANL